MGEVLLTNQPLKTAENVENYEITWNLNLDLDVEGMPFWVSSMLVLHAQVGMCPVDDSLVIYEWGALDKPTSENCLNTLTMTDLQQEGVHVAFPYPCELWVRQALFFGFCQCIFPRLLLGICAFVQNVFSHNYVVRRYFSCEEQ